MTLEEIKKEIEERVEIVLSPRNLSLTDIERHKVRIQALIALGQITVIMEEKDERRKSKD